MLKDDGSRAEYKELRNYFRKASALASREYYTEAVRNCEGDLKKLLGIVSSLMKKASCNVLPP